MFDRPIYQTQPKKPKTSKDILYDSRAFLLKDGPWFEYEIILFFLSFAEKKSIEKLKILHQESIHLFLY